MSGTPITDSAKSYDGTIGSDVMVVPATVAQILERHLRLILDAPRGSRHFEAAMASTRRCIEMADKGHGLLWVDTLKDWKP